MSEAELRIRKLLQDWKNNPLYWKNNKRKFRGYCVLRKPVKRTWYQYPKRPDIFDAISDYIEELLNDAIIEQIDKMCFVNNI